MRRILVVDDDPLVRQSLGEALAAPDTEVRLADSAEHALAMLGSPLPEVVLSDVRMTGMDGVELLRLIRERAPQVDVLLMTAFDDMATVVSAMREGAVEFLVKPLDLHELRRVLERVFEDRRIRASSPSASRGAAALMHHGEGHPDALIGHDPRMIAVFKLIGQAAGSRAMVLVRGESGTGKELIARAIHANSSHASEPFIAVNCAALPSTLLESELFGHVRGSFTGAAADRRGRFALAGCGTIFLDEIGDTTTDLQSKLLRVLQEREFTPVGAEHSARTEARVIAATHRDLEAMVQRGEFRADLYYRLRVVEITVPPLRDRMADIPALARHLVLRASAETGRPVPVLSRDALRLLMQQQWPGNVRELENTITRAVVLASGDVIRAEHVEAGVRQVSADAPLPTLDALEAQHVKRVMESTHGHKARAAAILGVSRPRLDRLLQKHGLE